MNYEGRMPNGLTVCLSSFLAQVVINKPNPRRRRKQVSDYLHRLLPSCRAMFMQAAQDDRRTPLDTVAKMDRHTTLGPIARVEDTQRMA